MQETTPTPSVLHRLKAGVLRFQTGVHAERAAEYLHAATHPQQPHTLVIACADSRVHVETVVSAGPGEVFITRNVGNMVPPYGEMQSGVAAVIEYAIAALKVQHVVVCGHSDCGAMKALLAPGSADAMPAVRSWLRFGQPALHAADHAALTAEAPATKLRQLTERNVLLQLEHLKTHPAVAGAMARGELTLSGWVYEIGSGEVRVAENGSAEFQPVGTAEAQSA